MAKLDAFQDVSERPVDFFPPPTPEEVTPVAETPVFRQESPDRTPESLPSEAGSPVEAPNASVFRKDTPEAQPGISNAVVDRPVDEPQNRLFRGEVIDQPPQRGLA